MGWEVLPFAYAASANLEWGLPSSSESSPNPGNKPPARHVQQHYELTRIPLSCRSKDQRIFHLTSIIVVSVISNAKNIQRQIILIKDMNRIEFRFIQPTLMPTQFKRYVIETAWRKAWPNASQPNYYQTHNPVASNL